MANPRATRWSRGPPGGHSWTELAVTRTARGVISAPTSSTTPAAATANHLPPAPLFRWRGQGPRAEPSSLRSRHGNATPGSRFPSLAGQRVRAITRSVLFEDDGAIEVARVDSSLVTFNDQARRGGRDADHQLHVAVGMYVLALARHDVAVPSGHRRGMPEPSELATLREEIAQAKRTRPLRNRFDPELRSRIVAVAQELIANGGTSDSVVASLGIPRTTVDRWLERVSRAPQLPELVPVVVDEQRPPRSFVLELGGGRVTGLEFDDVVEMLRRLR